MRGEGLRTLQSELHLLPLARPFISLPCPDFRWLGRPAEGYPWPFVGYLKVPGNPCSRPGPGAAKSLGQFLRRLHECPVEAWPAAPDKTDPELRFSALSKRCQGLAEADPAWAHLSRAALGRGKDCLQDRRSTQTTALHGDLRPGHVLFDEAGLPCGVIDWGDIQAGHPACDLSVGFTLFEGEAREEFFEEAGGCPEGDREAALLRALLYGPALMEYGILEEDQAMVDWGLEILLRTLG